MQYTVEQLRPSLTTAVTKLSQGKVQNSGAAHKVVELLHCHLTRSRVVE